MTTWQDYVVECRNRKTKETGKFLLSCNAPYQELDYHWRDIPYCGPKLDQHFIGQEKIWQKSEETDQWRFTTVKQHEERGWDLRPLREYG